MTTERFTLKINILNLLLIKPLMTEAKSLSLEGGETNRGETSGSWAATVSGDEWVG